MYRKILLCYDGSVEGRNALKDGADVALCMQAEAHLLAIIRTLAGRTIPEGVSATSIEQENDEASRILKEGVAWLKERGLDAHGYIAFGDPIAQIDAAARALGVDLIVLGHRHRSRLARWWSDAEDATLLERAPCSILVAVAPPII
ncbi:universal stress protein [Noviherbaspirillum sp. UKPF54]|uniref:universal stress protein n=1 Tax=Noviherbaspirillum sp. UKPF54 TaxID=2601898 RepID=UPI0011B1A933|nr:universal stress protein [Noviherbaspirillum sp. UKPF54]QDZ29481.1 universal stress protein [Noviherbaspirillum sp. UKPF54]